mgnify:FL=1
MNVSAGRGDEKFASHYFSRAKDDFVSFFAGQNIEILDVENHATTEGPFRVPHFAAPFLIRIL